jgi:hypothetical protein
VCVHRVRTYVRIPAQHSPYTHSATQHLEEAHNIELQQPVRVVQQRLLPRRLSLVPVAFTVSGSILPHPPYFFVQRLEVRFLHRSLCPFARSQAAAGVADAGCCTANKGDGMVAVVVEPEEDHYREEVAQVEGGSGGIDTGVDTDLFRLEDFVENIAVAV